MRFPSPPELGLPEEFDTWRDGQVEAIQYLQRSTRRVPALSADTGFGKGAVVVGDAILSREPTCFVTDSKLLQDQYLTTFASIGMVDLRGRRNYDCGLHEEYTCEEGIAARCPMRGTIQCPESQATMRAAISKYVVTNYDKWIAARMYGQGLEHIRRVVFDEADRSFHALARAMQITLHHHEIQEVLGMDFPTCDNLNFEVWKPWAAEARADCEQLMIAARTQVVTTSQPKPTLIRTYTHLQHLTRRLGILATANPRNWVVEQVERGYQFDPIRPGRYAESTLLLKVPKIIAISATLRPKTLFMIGLSRETFDFKEFESDFDPKRRPIYYVPTLRVDKRAHDLSPLWLKIDQVAARRRDRNGIIHPVSYSRGDDVKKHSRFSESMIINNRQEPTMEAIDQLIMSYPGAILVSPAVGAGFSFNRRAAEWQFLCKIPFPPSSRILKARTDDDPEYPYHIAGQTMAQIFGRIMRDNQDQGESFIVDTHCDWFLPRYGHLIPKSVRRRIQRVDVLPPPPPRLEA